MPAPVAVEPQRQPREWPWQQIEPWLELAPQRHEPEVRDVAVDERKDCSRTVIRVQSHRPTVRLSDRFHRETHFRAIPPLLDRFDDLRVGDVELADASQGVAHDGPLGRELRVVAQVLQLAAAAAVTDVVRAGCGDAGSGSADDFGELAAGEMLVELHAVAQPDAFAGRGSGNEHGAAVGQAPHAVAPRSDGGEDRKSTRLNSSHPVISYAVFRLKKKVPCLM